MRRAREFPGLCVNERAVDSEDKQRYQCKHQLPSKSLSTRPLQLSVLPNENLAAKLPLPKAVGGPPRIIKLHSMADRGREEDTRRRDGSPNLVLLLGPRARG